MRKTPKQVTTPDKQNLAFCTEQVKLWSDFTDPNDEAHLIAWVNLEHRAKQAAEKKAARSEKLLKQLQQQAQAKEAWNALDHPVGAILVGEHEVVRVKCGPDGKPYIVVIADFGLKLLSKQLSIEEHNTLLYELEFRNFTHKEHILIRLIPDTVMSDVRAFRRLCCNIDFNFFGNEDDLFTLSSQLLRMNNVPITHSTSTLGAVKRPKTGELCWATQDGVFDAQGELISDFRYFNHSPAVMAKFATNLRPNRQLSTSLEGATAIFDVNVPTVTFPVIGWLSACFYIHQLYEVNHTFPMLYLIGPPGAGKTEFTRRAVEGIFARLNDPLCSATGGTVASNMQFSAASYSIPFVFDDLKPNQYEKKTFLDLVQRLYNRAPARRGKAGGGTKLIEYPTITPMCITGERRIGDTATFERCICVDMDRTDSAPREAIFNSITPDLYEALGQALLDDSLRTPVVDLTEELEFFKELLPRNRNNAAAVLFGCRKVLQVLGLHDVSLDLVAPHILSLYQEADTGEIEKPITEARRVLDMIYSLQDCVFEEQGDRKVIRYSWPNHYLQEGVHYIVDETGAARYAINKVWERLEPFARQVHDREIMTSKDFYTSACKEGLISPAGRHRVKGLPSRNFYICCEPPRTYREVPDDVSDSNVLKLKLKERA